MPLSNHCVCVCVPSALPTCTAQAGSPDGEAQCRLPGHGAVVDKAELHEWAWVRQSHKNGARRGTEKYEQKQRKHQMAKGNVDFALINPPPLD